MLNGTRNTAGNINLGAHGNARLTNLKVGSAKTGIYSGATCSYFCMNFIGKLIKKFETVGTTYTITAGNNDSGTLKIVLGFLNMAFDNLNYVIGLSYTTSPL